MKGELHHALHPRRTYAMWALFYGCIFVGLIAGFSIVASRIKTYSLPTGALQLHIPYKTYLVGEPITFTLINQYNSAIYITNNCPREPLAVYKQQDNHWVRIHANTSSANCLGGDRQVRVAAGGEQSGSYSNWPELFAQPGKYRVVAYVEYFNAAPYQDFEVITRPAKPSAQNTPTLPTATSRTTTNSAAGNTTTSIPTATPTQTTATTPTSITTTPTQTTLPSKTVSVSTGSINVTYSSTTIYVQSIVPRAGCTYEGGRSGSKVEVTFKCSGSETQVTLQLSNGQLVYRVENGD